jgi:hypothetical protein
MKFSGPETEYIDFTHISAALSHGKIFTFLVLTKKKENKKHFHDRNPLLLIWAFTFLFPRGLHIVNPVLDVHFYSIIFSLPSFSPLRIVYCDT